MDLDLNAHQLVQEPNLKANAKSMRA
jgi:hypothetical protein